MGLCKEACLQTLNSREVSSMTNRTTIFRIENESEQGPYTSVGSKSWADNNDHVSMKNHPMPAEEGLEFEASMHRCCFTSMDMLDEWFTQSEQSRLSLLGFEIVELDVDTRYLQVGTHQAIFITDDDIPDFKEERY
jgi:hypothetical protein